MLDRFLCTPQIIGCAHSKLPTSVDCSVSSPEPARNWVARPGREEETKRFRPCNSQVFWQLSRLRSETPESQSLKLRSSLFYRTHPNPVPIVWSARLSVGRLCGNVRPPDRRGRPAPIRHGRFLRRARGGGWWGRTAQPINTHILIDPANAGRRPPPAPTVPNGGLPFKIPRTVGQRPPQSSAPQCAESATLVAAGPRGKARGCPCWSWMHRIRCGGRGRVATTYLRGEGVEHSDIIIGSVSPPFHLQGHSLAASPDGGPVARNPVADLINQINMGAQIRKRFIVTAFNPVPSPPPFPILLEGSHRPQRPLGGGAMGQKHESGIPNPPIPRKQTQHRQTVRRPD